MTALFSETTKIETPRLLLRPLYRDDAPALFVFMSDPVVMRFGTIRPGSRSNRRMTRLTNTGARYAPGTI